MAEFETLVSVERAHEVVVEQTRLRELACERVALHASVGRILADAVVAGHDLPPFANSAMDGFALRARDLSGTGETRLAIVGTRFAGDSHAATVEAGECLRITTGAPLPRGADSVVIKERVRVDGDVLIVADAQVVGANVRPAGEDYRAGEVALRAGERIDAGRLGVLASLGRAEVEVARRPRVVVMTTGNELVMPGHALGFAQIHNSNGYSIAAMLANAGALNVDGEAGFRHVRDDPALLRDALLDAATHADVIVTTGGVSAGEADFLPALLAEHGEVFFWKVRMRPGMPVLFGAIGGALVFGLPGNPVSSIATFLTLVRPALAALQGALEIAAPRVFARLAAPIHKRHDRTEYLRARSESRSDGTLWATALAKQGSGMLRGIVDADALIVVPGDRHELAVGDVVEMMRLPTPC